MSFALQDKTTPTFLRNDRFDVANLEQLNFKAKVSTAGQVGGKNRL
jgi:hypothetical protein